MNQDVMNYLLLSLLMSQGVVFWDYEKERDFRFAR